MKQIHLLLILCLLLGLKMSAGSPAPKFAFHRIFTDNMVLQREKPILICGTGSPGSEVQVRLGPHRKKAIVKPDGEWSAVFSPLPAGGPYNMILSGNPGARNIILSNILIGDVWLCSGASNMAMPVFSPNPYWQARNGHEERARGMHPRIRIYRTPETRSPLIPQNRPAGGEWRICTPENISGFSALAYFYGRELQRRLDIPIGLILAAEEDSPLEAWIPSAAFSNDPKEFSEELARIRDMKKFMNQAKEEADIEQQKQQWFADFKAHDPAATRAARNWKNFQCKDNDWEKTVMPWRFSPQYAGVAWLRNSFLLPLEFLGTELELHLGSIADSDTTYFNGRKIGETSGENNLLKKKNRVYIIPDGNAMRGKNVLAIRITDFQGNGGLRKKASEIYLRRPDNGKIYYLADNWKNKTEYLVATEKLPEIPVTSRDRCNRLDNHRFPGTLFNGMIAPWLRIPVQGIIWYQGCADIGRQNYYRRHQILISSWRKAWKNNAMPFLLVQLSGFEQHRPAHPLPDDFWKKLPPQNHVPLALTREIQAEMTKLPKVGMAVSIDRSEHSNCCPGDKQTIAVRLADEAMRLSGFSKKTPRSPVYHGMRIEGNKIRIYFRYAEPRLKTSDGQMPGCFAIAGKDGRFFWAKTQIIGSTVLVFSPDVPHPVNVRYGWTNYRGDLNLCSPDGVPAVPFRTDKPKYILLQDR